MDKFIIMADGRHENIFYTGRKGKYWSGDITKAKMYDDKTKAQDKVNVMQYNNPRVMALRLEVTPS